MKREKRSHGPLLAGSVGNAGTLLTALLLTACGGGQSMFGLDERESVLAPEGDAKSGTITYKSHIQPLFQKHCSICHNSSSAIPNWLDYNTAYAKRDRIFQRVVTEKSMPLGGAMPQAERDLVAAWIQGGAPFDSVASAPNGNTTPPPDSNSTPSPAPTATPAPPPPPPGTTITYKDHIGPVVQEKCTMCHNANSAIPNWTDYNVAYANRAKLRDRVYVRRDMPAVGTLTDAQRQMFADWVDGGAPFDSTGSAPPPAPSPTPTTPKPLTYDDLLKPRIFASVCIKCHNGEQTRLPNWQIYSNVCDRIDKIYDEVVEDKTMPKDMPFADSERKLIADWIRAGAPKSTTSGPCSELR